MRAACPFKPFSWLSNEITAPTINAKYSKAALSRWYQGPGLFQIHGTTSLEASLCASGHTACKGRQDQTCGLPHRLCNRPVVAVSETSRRSWGQSFEIVAELAHVNRPVHGDTKFVRRRGSRRGIGFYCCN